MMWVKELPSEAHAEVIDQSIRMLRSIRDCRGIGASDKEELDSFAAAFADVLSSLNHHIAIKSVTPETADENCFASGKEEKETPGFQNMTGFHHLPDEELDEIVRGFVSDRGRTSGPGYVGGYIKALGLRIQRKRLRESMTRVDPQNTALRRGVVVSRGTYQVPS